MITAIPKRTFLAGRTYVEGGKSKDVIAHKGVKMQFILDQEFEDPRDKQMLANQISVALQKKLGASGVMVDYDDRNPYRNVIGFIVPLNSVAMLIIKAMKAGG
jgi:hypothetical protein